MQAFLLVGSLSLSAASYAAAEPAAKQTRNVTWEDIANDHLTTKDVLQYGMGTNAQRWSPLAQVNDKNVFKLTPAWSYSFGDEKQRGQESQTIVSDGVAIVPLNSKNATIETIAAWSQDYENPTARLFKKLLRELAPQGHL